MPDIINIKPEPISVDPVAVEAFALVDNTFTAAEQSIATVEVGDSKDPDVCQPQFKMIRWKNEVNFSVRLVTDAPAVAVSTPEDVAAIQATTAQRIQAANNLKPGGSVLPVKPEPVDLEPVDDTPAVALVDDICSSGATLLAAATQLKAAGAASVDVAVVHALFDGAAEARLRAAGVRRIVSTTSIRHPTNGADLSALLAQALKDEIDR